MCKEQISYVQLVPAKILDLLLVYIRMPNMSSRGFQTQHIVSNLAYFISEKKEEAEKRLFILAEEQFLAFHDPLGPTFRRTQ